MSTILTDVDAWAASIVAPADGDNRNAASVVTPLQSLTNRTFNLRNLIYAATPVTVVRFVGAGYQSTADASGSAAGWVHNDASPTVAFSTGATTAKRHLSFDHMLPNGATITQVRARVDPAGAQGSTNRMSAQVFVGDITGTQYSSAVTYDDGTSSAQWITISGLSIVVDKTQRTYGVAVRNNAVTYIGDTFYGAEITFTTNNKFIG